MSDTDIIDDTPDVIAAEYVIGLLDAAEARAAETRAQTDNVFAAAIRFWEAKLIPLAALVPPIPPPATLWARIEDTTAGTLNATFPRTTAASRPANDNVLRWWQATTIAALATAAGLTAFITLRPPGAPPLPPAPAAYAVLTPTGTNLPVLVAVPGPNNALLIRASANLAVPANRDLQLWSLPVGAKTPASLGLLPAVGTQVQDVSPGTQLLVSLEPKGGSPTGLPTGPVVYGGTLRVLR